MGLVANARYTAVKRGISRLFEMGFMSGMPYYPTICTEAPSEGADEEYAIGGTVKGMREWIGDRIFGQISSAEFTIKNKLWESSLKFERHDVDDDRLGLLSNTMQDLGEEARLHPDELLFSLVARGHSNECWDGQNFYDTDHLWNDSSTQSNIITHDVADPANPTPQEIKAGFHKALIRMHEFKRDNGKPWLRPQIQPLQNVRMNVPTELMQVSWEAFAGNLQLQTQGAAFAAVSNIALVVPTIDNIPYLSPNVDSGGSSTSFYVHYLGGRIKPFVFQRRQNLRQQSKGAEDLEFKEIKHMTEARYNVGYLAWPFSVKVNLT